MSNNSWKQFGGMNQIDNFTALNAGTIIADQFLTRTVKPTDNIFNGDVTVTNDINTGNSIDVNKSVFINEDLYLNRKVYFYGEKDRLFINKNYIEDVDDIDSYQYSIRYDSLPDFDNSFAYMYGDVSFIGLNTIDPNGAVHISNQHNTDISDVLIVSSGQTYMRSIIAKNKDNKGVRFEVDNSMSIMEFHHTDMCNNLTNSYIKNEENNLFIQSNDNVFLDSSNVYINTGKSVLSLDNSYNYLDASNQIILRSYHDDYIVNPDKYNNSADIIDTSYSSRIILDGSNQLLSLDCSGDILLDTSYSNILVNNNINFETTGSIDFISDEINFTSKIDKEYLSDYYNDSSIKTGNPINLGTVDMSSNIFINFNINNDTSFNNGGTIGGGANPVDISNSFLTLGLNDFLGNYIPSQNIISNRDNPIYNRSIIGINNYSSDNNYGLNINSNTYITNGEIHTLQTLDIETKLMKFSHISPNFGIIVGSPNTTSELNFKQNIYYTTDTGITWLKSNIYKHQKGDAFDDLPVFFNTISFFDNNLVIIGGTNNKIFYSTDGGINFYNLIYTLDNISADSQNTRSLTNIKMVQTNNGTRLYLPHINEITINGIVDTTNILRYIDINTSEFALLFNNNNDNLLINSIDILNSDFTINDSAIINDKTIFVGDGILILDNNSNYKSDANDLNLDIPIRKLLNYSYNSIKKYNNYIFCIGYNIISYSSDNGDTFTNIEFHESYNFTDINFFGDSNVIIIGNNGLILYSTDYITWQNIPDNILNSSGIANIITNNMFNLQNIHTTNIDNFLITQKLNNYTENTKGLSKVLSIYLPNMFNRKKNVVLRVSGKTDIIGDTSMNGELAVSGDVSLNNKLFVAQDVSFDEHLFVGNDVSLNNKLFVAQDVSFDEHLFVGNDVSLNNKLFVAEDVSFDEHLFVGNDVSLNNKLFVAQDVSFDEHLFVGNDVSFHEKLYVGNDVSFDQKLFVGNDVVFNSHFYVNGDSSFNGDVTVRGNIKADLITNEYIINTQTTNYTVVVAEDLSLNGSLFVIEDTSLNERLFVRGDVSLNNNLFVTQDVSFDEHLFVGNDVSFNNELFVAQDVSFDEHLFVGNDVSLNNELFVAQDVSFDEHLFVGNDVSFNNELFVGNDVSFDEHLFVGNDVSFNNELFVAQDVSFDEHLFVGNDVSLNNELFVAQDVSFDEHLFVGNDVSLNNELFVAQDVSFDEHLFVGNDVSLNNKLFVAQDISFDEHLFVGNDVSFNNKLFVAQDVSFDQRLFVGNDVSLNSNFYVNGDSSFNGDVTIIGNIKADLITKEYIINTQTTNYTLMVTEDLSLNGNLFVASKIGVAGTGLPKVTLDISATDAIRIPCGGSNERPTQLQTGQLRFNTQTELFEGYGTNYWGSLGGVRDVDQNTYISAEDTPGSNNDQLKFVTAGSQRMLIDSNGVVSLFNNLILNDKLNINAPYNTLGLVNIRCVENPDSQWYNGVNVLAYDTNNNASVMIGRSGTGTGKSFLSINTLGSQGNWTIGTDSTYTLGIKNTWDYSGDRIFEISASTQNVSIGTKLGIGTTTPNTILDISGADALRIPVGDEDDRPSIGLTGQIRFNTDSESYEGYGISDWAPLGGGGVKDGDEDTYITADNNGVDSDELKFYTDGNLGMTLDSDGLVNVNKKLTINKPSITSQAFPNGSWVELNHSTYHGAVGPLYASQKYECGINMSNNGSGGTEQWGMFMGVKKAVAGTSSNSLTLDFGSINNEPGGGHGDGDNYLITTGLSMDVYGNVTATSYDAISDIRHKENVHDLENALEKIKAIRGVNFTFKRDDRIHSGIIAQEVADIIPEAICKNDDEKWTANYNTFISYLIESVKTLSKENEQLKEKVNTVEEKLNSLIEFISTKTN